MKILLTIFFLFLFLSESSFSHSGGLNQQGCHNNRKTGGYHCHRTKIIPPVKKYNCKLTIGDQYYKFDPSSTYNKNLKFKNNDGNVNIACNWNV